jgi:HD-GYP domain-containing protein (c-di-GMP phosphodiesterase class II)
MSQTILIEPHDDLRKIFSLNLNTFVGTNIIIRKNAEETIELLKILPEISLIISKVKVGQEPTAQKIYDHIKQEGLQTNMIVLGECPPLEEEATCLKDPINWEILMKEAARHLGVSIKDSINKIKPDYLPVSLIYFLDIQRTPCDVFIRIKKGVNEYQFVKRINSKDTFDLQTIQKYQEQGLKEFYVSRDYIQYFTTFVTNQLVQKLEREDISVQDRILTTANALDIVRENILTIGLDDATIELAEASINSMINSVKNSPEVVSLLKFLFSNKVSYAYQHSHLLALMCHYVLSKQSWYKSEHLQILCFVSFFSDVTLKSQQQMQISNMRDLNESNLTAEEKDAVLKHASHAVEILDKSPDVSDYIKTVLVQSHGSLNGIGLVDNPPEELHPLSKVFVICDNFVKILLNPVLPSTKKDILPILYSRFTNPSYQKILKALESRYP